jgi:hypothetical protein
MRIVTAEVSAKAFATALFIILARAVGSSAAVISGHVEGWGDDTWGQATPPRGLDGVVAVAGGSQHSLALRTNGTVVGWGLGGEGQTNIPPGLSNVVAISTALHCVALKADGTVVVWGNSNEAVTNPPANLNGVKAIAAGDLSGRSYTLALRSNGTVVAWGLNAFTTNVPPGLSGVIQIAAGLGHGLALKSDGTVVGWGDDASGQATPPPELTEVVAVRAGTRSSIAVKSDGTVVKWGAFWGVPAGLAPVMDVQLGNSHAVVLYSNGVAAVWDAFGLTPAPNGLSGVVGIAAGENHSLAISRRPLIFSISPSVLALAGESVTFEVAASGPPSLTYQWRRNGVNVSNGTNSSLIIPNMGSSDVGVYDVFVTNPYGSTLSPSTSLAFRPPTITSQPESITRYRGESAFFSVSATGSAPLTYQWFKGTESLGGATLPTLTVTNLRRTNAGSYRVVIGDSVGKSTTSATATLTIVDPTVTNLAVLAPVADTGIHSASGGNLIGVGSILAGTRRNGIVDRGLLRFDLSSIPTGVVIRSATLRLAVIRVPRFPANSDFSLYRMLRRWGEDADWGQATAGTAWSAPGGQEGVDYSGSKSSIRFVAGLGTYDFGPSSRMTEDIQAWLASPSANYGWMLKSDSENVGGSARHFGSRESTQPPQLLLQYGNPAAVRLTNMMVEGGNLVFQFDAADGWFYRAEARVDPGTGVWTAVTNFPAGPARTLNVSAAINMPRSFYRVVAD